jgi:hypothetical protein
MFERAAPLTALRQKDSLAWHSIERVGPDLRVIARVAHGGGA